MFKVSRKIIYAIEAVVDIAYYSGVKPVQNIESAKRQGIPKRYLEQTLQTLVKSKILIGSRGPRGGYRLAKERRKIKVSDIVKSFDQSWAAEPVCCLAQETHIGVCHTETRSKAAAPACGHFEGTQDTLQQNKHYS